MNTAQRFAKLYLQAKEKRRAYLKKQILKESVSSEQFGFDDWLYHFKDDSCILHRKLVNEFVI